MSRPFRLIVSAPLPASSTAIHQFAAGGHQDFSSGSGVRLRNRIPQQRSHFFLNVDHDVSLTQIFTQVRILTAKLLGFLFHRITLGLRPALLRRQGLEDAVGPLAPPGCQQRRVQAFPAEENSDTASCGGGGLGFLQDAQFVFRGEGAPLWFRDHFGIRSRGQHRIGARFGCRSTALRLAALASAPFRASQSPGGQNPKRIPAHLSLFLSRPAH